MPEIKKKNWEDLARAARVEQDSEKLIEIVEELNRVLDENHKPPQPDTTLAMSPRVSASMLY